MSKEDSKSTVSTGEPQEWKKYDTYNIKVDPDQDDKATEIRICKFGRPHMRAFHCAWWGFFIAFFIWFAIAPLMPEIKKTLGLSKKQVWTSNIIGVSGTVFTRFLLGPLCDKYGARRLFSIVLILAAIPTACTGAVQDATGLYILRLFIGLAGGSFIMCQFWTGRMFTKEIVGTANAVAAGWGNLGGGVTQLVMGTMLFPLFKVFYDGDAEKAWRTVCIVPAFVTMVSGALIWCISDDTPKGNFDELKKYGVMPEISATASFRKGAWNFNTWVMALQYACCFGVELTFDNAAASYFHEEFGQSTESAAAIASLFGWMNLFSRGLGGFVSDKANTRYGMRGRLWAQFLVFSMEGIMVLVFAKTKSLGAAIFVLIVFSLFCQAGCGTSFGIVPYIDPAAYGSISGIVGAGGNIGAIGFGLAFRQLNYEKGFVIMGLTILVASVSCVLIKIKGHAMLLCGEDDPLVTKSKTLTVPQPDDSNNEDEEEVVETDINTDNKQQAKLDL